MNELSSPVRRPRRAWPIVFLAALFLSAGSAEAGKKISGNKIKKGAIATKHLQTGAVTSDAIADGSIAPGDLSAAARTPVAGSVGNAVLQDDAVDGDKIEDGSITSDDVADELLPPGVAYSTPDSTVSIGVSEPTRVVAATVTLLAPVDGHITVLSSGNAFCSSGGTPDLVHRFVVTETGGNVTESPARDSAIPANDFQRFASTWAQPIVAGSTQVDIVAHCANAISGSMFVETLSVSFFPNLYQ